MNHAALIMVFAEPLDLVLEHTVLQGLDRRELRRRIDAKLVALRYHWVPRTVVRVEWAWLTKEEAGAYYLNAAGRPIIMGESRV